MSSDANINMHFYEFGKKMKIVAIMVILMIIPYAGNFLMLIGWIFAILALQNIQSANFGPGRRRSRASRHVPAR